MDSQEFRQEFLTSVKAAAAVSGEGSCAAFVDEMAQYLIDVEVLADFQPSFYTATKSNKKYRVDGYNYDDFDDSLYLIIASYSGSGEENTLTNTIANRLFGQLRLFIDMALKTNLYEQIEMSTPCSDLIDLMRRNKERIRKYKLIIFTDSEMSAAIKNIDIEAIDEVPVEGQIWDLERLYRVCCSDLSRQIVEINFLDFCEEGIPCIEASNAKSENYTSYLGIIPGSVLADIYDKYGSRLLEGNVRSFLSTKVAVNKQIRTTLLKEPKMFFAFNNGISATALGVKIADTDHGRFITFARDFQIINGGQTTASISNARFRDKAVLDEVFVQMKLTEIADTASQDDTDTLIRNISRSSNSQNKVSDADFFASHPFHRRMETISRKLFAPATDGAQYETKWFYERARGQYLQEQMHLTPAKKRQFALQHPKNKVIKKTDLAKVQNTWLMNPHIVSRGAQTNFNAFAEWIDDMWEKDDFVFNERYYQSTAALLLMFQFLERQIPKLSWYEGGYRANIIYYTIALFHLLITRQFPGNDFDLILIWNKQDLPDIVQHSLLELSEKVFYTITDPKRSIINVTQWCKKQDCWDSVKKIVYILPKEIEICLTDNSTAKAAERQAKKDQRMTNDINSEVEVVKYPADFWKRLTKFVVEHHLIDLRDQKALTIACSIPERIPNAVQSKRLLAILEKAKDEGFKDE